ncbi:MAG: ribosomal protein [Bacteroidota bacterium]|jgi:large subunit ribosomal protein L9
MQVILIKDIDTLGQTNEVVKVKPGYARNFLIPQKFAIEASAGNLAVVNQKVKAAQKKEAALLSAIADVSAKLKDGALKVTAKAGEGNKLFGSITNTQLARAVREQKGYEIDRKRISIIDEVKTLGTFKAHIDLGQSEPVEVEFEVAAEA